MVRVGRGEEVVLVKFIFVVVIQEVVEGTGTGVCVCVGGAIMHNTIVVVLNIVFVLKNKKTFFGKKTTKFIKLTISQHSHPTHQ